MAFLSKKLPRRTLLKGIGTTMALHRGVLARGPEWIFLGRGERREGNDAEGFRIGHVTDEVPSRGIWRHYRSLMEAR